MPQRDPTTGKFIATVGQGSERISFRLSPTTYWELIDFSNGEISHYARQAILEKLERDKQKQVAGANN